MDVTTAGYMHKIRDINNEKIINLEVLREDKEIYPIAIKKLINRFAGLTLENTNEIRELREANFNLDLAERFIGNYRGTPDEGFAEFIITTTPEIYDFNEKMIKSCREHNEISFNQKMALEFGAEYLSTLSDIEFLNLLTSQELITANQRESLTRTYKSIGIEELIKEQSQSEEWKRISKMQAEATQRMIDMSNPVGGGLTEGQEEQR